MAACAGHCKRPQPLKNTTMDKPKETSSPDLRNQTGPSNYQINNMTEKLKLIYQFLNGIKRMKNADLHSTQALPQSYIDCLMAENTTGKNSVKSLHNSPLPGHARRRSSVGLQLPSLDTRTSIIGSEIPPWQIFAKDGNRLVQPKPPAHRQTDNTFVEEQRHKFKAMQEKLRNDSLRTIAERKSTEAARVACLKKAWHRMAGAMFPRVMKEMTDINKSFHSDPPPPSWLAGLEEDIEKKIGFQNKAMSDELTKMRSFSTFKFSSIPHAKEKLCLLALSLPMITLMRPAVQEALWFIMDCVLHRPAKEVFSWYRYKRLERYPKEESKS